MRHRPKLIAFTVALILMVTATMPLGLAGFGQSAAVSSTSATNAPANDEAQRPKRDGSSFGRALTAPFRALARLFGGRKKRTGIEAKVKEQKGARGAGVSIVEQADQPASVQPTAQQSANIIRPDEGQVQPVAPGMWIPVIEGIPKDHLSQGRALLQHGYLNEAMAELSIATAIGPDLIEANNLLGLAYDKRGWHKQAVECYERALAVAPGDPQVLNNLGYSLYLDNQFVAALRLLTHAARQAPGAPVVLGNLGIVQARLGKYDDAFKSFVRAGGEYDARLRIAPILEQAGRYAEAIKHYEAALRIQSGSPAILEHLAELYDRTGRRNEAEAARRKLSNPPNKQRTATGGGR